MSNMIHRSWRGPYKRPRQKFPSNRKRHRVGAGTHQANRWGAEWYYRQREQAEITQACQSLAKARAAAISQDGVFP